MQLDFWYYVESVNECINRAGALNVVVDNVHRLVVSQLY
jgi:hypothetical protein